ncbi:hypothetical protein P7M09_25220, partial [Vibrio parahaemolyticus]|nr:hypothetical protein [Vibrio parahaemolyticus]
DFDHLSWGAYVIKITANTFLPRNTFYKKIDSCVNDTTAKQNNNRRLYVKNNNNHKDYILIGEIVSTN